MLGRLAVFADESDESLSGAREAAVAAVDETQLAEEVDTFYIKKFDFAGSVTMPTSTEPSSTRCRILWLKLR